MSLNRNRILLNKFASNIYLQNALAMAMLSKIAMSGIERMPLPSSLTASTKVYIRFPFTMVNGGKENGGKPSVMLPVIWKGSIS